MLTPDLEALLPATGWQRLIGCLESQVIFRKRATNYRALLRKMTCKDRGSFESWPPCTACQFRVLRGGSPNGRPPSFPSQTGRLFHTYCSLKKNGNITFPIF